MLKENSNNNKIEILPRTISGASLAFFHLAAQLLAALRLHKKIFPSLDQCFAYRLGHIAHKSTGDHVVIALDVPVEHALKVKAVATLAELVEVLYLRPVLDVALAADRRERAGIRVH